MRPGISQQLSLLLTGAVALAVLTVGGLSAWTLRNGFSDYLRLQDEERMTQLAQMVQVRATAEASMAWLTNDRQAMRELMDQLHGRLPHPDELDDSPPPQPPPPWRGRPPPRPDHEPGDHADRPPPGQDQRPPHSTRYPGTPPVSQIPAPSDPQPGTLFDRVVITDAQGRWLAGRRQPPGTGRSVRSVELNGATVAYLTLTPQIRPVGLDAIFLRRQYADLVGGGLLTVLVALLAAWVIARRWSRPLLALSQASRQIAAGERRITLQPAGAHEMAQLAEDMNHMVQSLARLEQARRLWIAQISHELRTPLAVLRGELEAIEDGARQPTPAVLTSLGEEVMQLNRLVDDLHMLSVADMGALHCDFQAGDADALLRRMVARFDAPARQRGLRLTWPEDPAPVAACWDFQRIEQLLTNLLSNSLRYTDAPGELRVRWQISAHPDELTLTVEDSAPGVQPEDLSQLFEPLYRADKARQRGAEHGSGLGLAIVRSIAAAHQGQVSAQLSTLGGLLLTVRLPLQAPTPVNDTPTRS